MNARIRGFTLVEVITSLAICLALAALATGTFMQVRTVLRRTQARLELHNSARFIYNTLRTDLLAMQQDGALFIETVQDAKPGDPLGYPTHTGEVRLTFLRGKADNDESNPQLESEYPSHPNFENTDLLWTQWAFRQTIHSLCTGSNARMRYLELDTIWKDNGLDFGGDGGVLVSNTSEEFGRNGHWSPGHWVASHSYEMMPSPRRLAGVGARETLDDNSWGSGHKDDIGDYTDLVNHIAPITRSVTSFDLQVALYDGTVLNAGIGATAKIPIDGCYVDGRAKDPSYLKRPRMFRIRFDLTDFNVGLTQSFCFSFPAPGQHPSL